jgi:UDPglucose--hexose-1-phosphate uridylyltransferase
MSELRWNPMLAEWVATATHRQDRTFLPPKNFCPLCPSRPGGFATEIPAPDYDIVVFENKFPSFSRQPERPAVEPAPHSPVRPSEGRCEVVVYTPDHTSSLAAQRVEQIDKLVRVWTDRFQHLDAIASIEYVFIFENKGEAIGVTLAHPHGQIYAYPFVPPRIARELEQFHAHKLRMGHCLLCAIIDDEMSDGRRLLAENPSFVAYIPFFARWPYEVHICSRRHAQALVDLDRGEQRDLAEILKSVLVAYDALWGMSMPYMMVMHQRPSDGGNYSHYHFHIELYPPLRMRDRLKYLAGSETGAGVFINDSLPEVKAAELRAHVKPVVWNEGAHD